MKPHLQYLSYVFRHKWYVFVECCKLGIPLLGILHDWSKFRPSEWFSYVDYFHGSNVKKIQDKTGYYKPIDTGHARFDFAWFLHQKRNKHHWQYWQIPGDGWGSKPLLIPHKYRREMLADWRGASRAQGGTSDVTEWYEKNGQKLQLDKTTRDWVKDQIKPCQN